MTAFGREGRGVFMAPTVLEAETVVQFGVEVIGRTDELVEEFFAVSVERRITHPAWWPLPMPRAGSCSASEFFAGLV